MKTASFAMIGATALWGASGGVVAAIHANGFVAAAVVELVSGVTLLAVGAACGHRPLAVLRALRRRLPLLAVIEAANVVFYYVALQIGPIGPVMAMHLTAPIILSAIAMFRGRLRFSYRRGVSLALVGAALAAFALKGGGGTNHAGLLIGIGLSLCSAICLAFFITLVRDVANDVPPVTAAGMQMLCSGLLLSPALLLSWHDLEATGNLALIGLVLFAPACWLYWKAMRVLKPIPAGTIQLAEPVFGALAAFTLTAAVPTSPEVLAALLVLAAVYAELSSDQLLERAGRPAADAPTPTSGIGLSPARSD